MKVKRESPELLQNPWFILLELKSPGAHLEEWFALSIPHLPLVLNGFILFHSWMISLPLFTAHCSPPFPATNFSWANRDRSDPPPSAEWTPNVTGTPDALHSSGCLVVLLPKHAHGFSTSLSPSNPRSYWFMKPGPSIYSSPWHTVANMFCIVSCLAFPFQIKLDSLKAASLERTA